MRALATSMLLLTLGCAGAATPRAAGPGRGAAEEGERSPARAGADDAEPDAGADEAEDAPYTSGERGAVADALTRAFETRLTVHVRRDGTRVLSRRCRQGPVPCMERVSVFAGMLAAAARRHGLDPFLLGALALRESGLDPSAVNRRSGAAGILQLHPRGVGRGSRFVMDAEHRARCQSRVDACQAPIVERGAQALAQAVEECGSLRAALGAYATGHCTTRARHIGRVLEERATLRAAARSPAR